MVIPLVSHFSVICELKTFCFSDFFLFYVIFTYTLVALHTRHDLQPNITISTDPDHNIFPLFTYPCVLLSSFPVPTNHFSFFPPAIHKREKVKALSSQKPRLPTPHFLHKSTSQVKRKNHGSHSVLQ